MEPGPIEAGVFSSRPLVPLPDAVSDALETPSREEVLRGLEVGQLWRRTVLRARLVQAFADHARRCGAARIVAGGGGVLPLASSVAHRLRIPLELPTEVEGGRRGTAGGPYLVARVLHEREEGHRFSGKQQEWSSAVGAGVLFRVRSTKAGGTGADNLLFIIDL